MISSILRARNFAGKFSVFDSFEGLSDFNDVDHNIRINLTKPQISEQQKLFATSEDLVKANLSEFDFIEFYKGWIPDRFNEVAHRRFILVNIDVVLYQPTKDSFQFFYPRLVEGGVMFFNEFGYTQYPGGTVAIEEMLAINKPSVFYKIPTGGAFLIK